MASQMKQLMESFNTWLEHRGAPAPKHIQQDRERKSDRKAKRKRTNARAIHPGYEPLKSLSKGNVGLGNLTNGSIMEEEPSEEIPTSSTGRKKVSIVVKARPLPTVSSPGGEDPEQLSDVDEDKQKNCGVGDPYHSKSDGRFVSADKAGSYSLSHPKRSDCTTGQSQMKGKNRLIVKKDPEHKRCGRVDPKKGSPKTAYKCSGGQLWETETDESGVVYVRVPLDAINDAIQQVNNYKMNSQDIVESSEREKWKGACFSRGFYDLAFYQNLLNNMNLASDGKLNDDPKD